MNALQISLALYCHWLKQEQRDRLASMAFACYNRNHDRKLSNEESKK